jgi:hypothetical protein
VIIHTHRLIVAGNNFGAKLFNSAADSSAKQYRQLFYLRSNLSKYFLLLRQNNERLSPATLFIKFVLAGKRTRGLSYIFCHLIAQLQRPPPFVYFLLSPTGAISQMLASP